MHQVRQVLVQAAELVARVFLQSSELSGRVVLRLLCLADLVPQAGSAPEAQFQTACDAPLQLTFKEGVLKRQRRDSYRVRLAGRT